MKPFSRWCRYTFFVTFVILIPLPVQADSAPRYYEAMNYGSESLYSPLGNFLSYAFDTLQLPESFDTKDFDGRFDRVMDHLGDPKDAIAQEGGFKRFINRQIFPIDPAHSNDSWAILPNYFLHLLGGGIAYRKDLEWFDARGDQHGVLKASVLAMTSEIIQEVFEKKTTTDDDEVADVYLFRPIGMLLFSNDRIANKVMRTLDPAVWPYLQVYDPSEDRLMNLGINYIYRPPITTVKNSRLFIFTGLNNLVGISHEMGEDEAFSWGIGLATQRVDDTLSQQSDLEPSIGLFYDRNKSLLWSFVLNDTGNNHFRFNLFPLQDTGLGSAGYFVSQHEDDSWSFGVTYRFQLGIGHTIR